MFNDKEPKTILDCESDIYALEHIANLIYGVAKSLDGDEHLRPTLAYLSELLDYHRARLEKLLDIQEETKYGPQRS